MKNVFVNLFSASLLLIASSLYGQTPGDFNVINNTDCDYDIVLEYTSLGCSINGCGGGYMASAQNQAQQNATTKVDDGSGYSGFNAWINIYVQNPVGSGSVDDGYCNTNTPGPECNGHDIKVRFIDCHTAQIDY